MVAMSIATAHAGNNLTYALCQVWNARDEMKIDFGTCIPNDSGFTVFSA
jgi:hypothetical protein